MAIDADWVEEVKHWYFAGRAEPVAAVAVDASSAEEYSLGYESAHPALQARNWPDAPADTPSGSTIPD